MYFIHILNSPLLYSPSTTFISSKYKLNLRTIITTTLSIEEPSRFFSAVEQFFMKPCSTIGNDRWHSACHTFSVLLFICRPFTRSPSMYFTNSAFRPLSDNSTIRFKLTDIMYSNSTRIFSTTDYHTDSNNTLILIQNQLRTISWI